MQLLTDLSLPEPYLPLALGVNSQTPKMEILQLSQLQNFQFYFAVSLYCILQHSLHALSHPVN